MSKIIDLQPAEKVLGKARAMMSNIQESSFSWPDRGAFEADIETTSTLLAEMQQALSGLVAQLSEHGDLVYEQRLESEVGEANHKPYNLLSRLYDDLHAIEDDGPSEPASEESFEQAKIHFQQNTNHYLISTNVQPIEATPQFGVR